MPKYSKSAPKKLCRSLVTYLQDVPHSDLAVRVHGDHVSLVVQHVVPDYSGIACEFERAEKKRGSFSNWRPVHTLRANLAIGNADATRTQPSTLAPPCDPVRAACTCMLLHWCLGVPFRDWMGISHQEQWQTAPGAHTRGAHCCMQAHPRACVRRVSVSCQARQKRV